MPKQLPTRPGYRSEDPCQAPFAYAQVILTKQAYIQLKWDANYWHAEWQRLRIREQEALQRVAELKAQLRAEHEQTQSCSTNQPADFSDRLLVSFVSADPCRP